MLSSRKFVPKKKSPVVKTLQWLGVSAVLILLVVYFLVADTKGSQKTTTIGSVNGRPIILYKYKPIRQIDTYYHGLEIRLIMKWIWLSDMLFLLYF